MAGHIGDVGKVLTAREVAATVQDLIPDTQLCQGTRVEAYQSVFDVYDRNVWLVLGDDRELVGGKALSTKPEDWQRSKTSCLPAMVEAAAMKLAERRKES